MIQIKETPYFAKWLVKLKDNKAKIAIFRRLNRVRQGNFGDHKALGDGLYELRFTIGAGYRITIYKRVMLLLFYWQVETSHHRQKISKKQKS